MPLYSKNKTQKSYKKPALVIVALLLIGAAGLGFYQWNTNRKAASIQPIDLTQGTATPSPDVPGSKNSRSDSGSTTTPKDNPVSGQALAPASDVQPATPSGQFVSNYTPNLDGNPLPNKENSICQTTPGVMCQIRFTMDSTVRTLPLQKTNANGTTSWDWRLQDIGLTRGTWKITAIAINGAKTASTNDAMQLVVNP